MINNEVLYHVHRDILIACLVWRSNWFGMEWCSIWKGISSSDAFRRDELVRHNLAFVGLGRVAWWRMTPFQHANQMFWLGSEFGLDDSGRLQVMNQTSYKIFNLLIVVIGLECMRVIVDEWEECAYVNICVYIVLKKQQYGENSLRSSMPRHCWPE